MPSPSISLIIATYNWPQALAVVLRSVRAQQVWPTEVLIADDGSRSDTRALIDRERAGLPVPLVHVWHEDAGFRLAAIRNKAIAQARGDYIVQIDGDVVLHPRFIQAHAAYARGERGAERRVRGCHMAFWRDDLRRVKGYDEAMEGWGREDSELAARLSNAGVVRRNLKFAAVCYHLWHRSASTESVARNHDRFLRTVRERRTWCDHGLDQYLSPANRVA
ncbi:MAG: glycosyltransferase family 2 protein [Gemmatimonas sp.]|nr:glycosyltransferase family 2 protein [Gemmatimonas sp.]